MKNITVHNSKYYRPCPKCGANLDPGENCDCERGFKNGLFKQQP